MESNKDTIVAVVGIFSGRPNPELSLTGEAVETLGDLVRKSVGAESIHPPPPARLGFYYGFRVTTPEELAKRFQLPTEFNVFRGVLTVPEDGKQRHWRDVAGVEKYLIDQTFEQGYGELIEKVGISKPG